MGCTGSDGGAGGSFGLGAGAASVDFGRGATVFDDTDDTGSRSPLVDVLGAGSVLRMGLPLEVEFTVLEVAGAAFTVAVVTTVFVLDTTAFDVEAVPRRSVRV